MRVYLFTIITFLSVAACQTRDVKKKELWQLATDTARFSTIKWIDSVKNIGTVEAGKKTEIKFRFKNTGEKPLYIISAEPGCGCTVADYPKQAIVAGAEGLITAEYTVHEGTTGEFRKNIHVTTNTKDATSHYIFFYGAIKSEGDSTRSRRLDAASLKAIELKESKRNLLLKPTKN